MGHSGVDFLGGLGVGSSREGINNAVAFPGGMANGECELGKEVEPSSLAWGDVFLGEDGRNDGVVSADGEVLPVAVRAPDCEGVNHDEEFFLVGGVIHLRGKELLACEGDGVFVGWSLGVSGADNVAKVFDTRSGKRTFAELGVEFLLSEDREDLVNVLKVGLEGGAKDEDVIKVHDDTYFKEVTKDVVHGGLECGGGIGECKRHYEELVVPEPRAECGLVGVLFADTNLVEATAEVDLGEIFGSTEAIKKFRYPGEWVLVLDCDPVQGTVVCAHAEFRGVVLLDEETTGSKGGARLNESIFKEFIEVALHFFGLGDGELVWTAARRRMVGLEINGVRYTLIGR
ncbi:hypothetical protein CBR_g46425 [Chara braunii]|uniref:Uncharacterized protein n=1 Tax=Chara braunii TaxID=69332 RepID=A0A388M0H6_CHABU|nr:hypothetical protein CBR_g46425 [Chara braunii]|eukprot:GBG88056.1 hypothetical protein CBR_g46425 [Chara braunii]